MQRTNVYLDERQLALLRELGRQRGEPVAALVRDAVDAWLDRQQVRLIEPTERQRRLERLLARRDRLASEHAYDPAQVERDVGDAIREVREDRTAGRS